MAKKFHQFDGTHWFSFLGGPPLGCIPTFFATPILAILLFFIFLLPIFPAAVTGERDLELALGRFLMGKPQKFQGWFYRGAIPMTPGSSTPGPGIGW